jgi:hypothetical protein
VLRREEDTYYELLEKHFDRHIQELGIPERPAE